MQRHQPRPLAPATVTAAATIACSSGSGGPFTAGPQGTHLTRDGRPAALTAGGSHPGFGRGAGPEGDGGSRRIATGGRSADAGPVGARRAPRPPTGARRRGCRSRRRRARAASSAPAPRGPRPSPGRARRRRRRRRRCRGSGLLRLARQPRDEHRGPGHGGRSRSGRRPRATVSPGVRSTADTGPPPAPDRLGVSPANSGIAGQRAEDVERRLRSPTCPPTCSAHSSA